MTIEALAYINDTLEHLGIPYEYPEWTSDIVFPFWVGEQYETEPIDEDGRTETTFILTGTTNNTMTELETVKETLKNYFGYTGKTELLESGRGIAISYGGGELIPSLDQGIKRMQISLSVKEWGIN